MRTFEDFLRWYNNKDSFPTPEAMQKLLEFYHNKGIDMLKLGWTLPNRAKIRLHNSTTAKFYPFTESDKNLMEEVGEDMIGGLSIVFTKEAVLDDTFIRDSTNWCKSIFVIDASQLGFLYVSSNANWSVYELGTRFGIWQNNAATTREEDSWKHGHVILSASQNTM